MVDLAAVDGSFCDGVDGFVRDGGEFLSHFSFLGAAFGFVPCFLFFIECDAVFRFEGFEIFGEFGVAGEFPVFESVFGLVFP